MQFLPSSSDAYAMQYSALFERVVMVTWVSLAVFFATQCLDVFLFQWLSSRYASLSVALKTFLCLAVSQAFDTAVFTIFGLGKWGVGFWHIFVFSYAIKLAVVLLVCPLGVRLEHGMQGVYRWFVFHRAAQQG